MDYTVKNISDQGVTKDFLSIPYNVYRDDKEWIAPLNSEVSRILNPNANPYYRNATLELFVCYKSGEPVARSAVVINYAHWEKFGKKSAFFGFFESRNDLNAANILFESIEKYCKAKGAECIEGPFNPNHYSEIGMQTSSFDTPPLFFETYNPMYYNNLVENCGFHVYARLHTRINTQAKDYLIRQYGHVSFPDGYDRYKVRCFSLLQFKSDLEKIREINNDAFSGNWYFLPLSKEEYLFAAKYLFFATSPAMIVFVEHKDEPVGIVQMIPNINRILHGMKGKGNPLNFARLLLRRSSIPELIIYTVGIKKTYQHTRVASLLFQILCSICQRYPVVSTTWMYDDNVNALSAVERLGLEPYKWFAIYEKKI